MSDNGITLENRIELRYGETKGRVFVTAFAFFLRVFGVGSFAVCVRDCLVPEADLKTVFIYVLATAVLLTAAGALGRAEVLANLAVLVAESVIYLANMTAVNSGFRHMYLRELEAIESSYSVNLEVGTTVPAPAEATAALVCLSLIVLLSIHLSIRFYRLSALGTLVPLIPIVLCIVAGKVPGALPLASIAAFFAAINSQATDMSGPADSADTRAKRRYRDHTDLIRFSNAGICLILLGICMLVTSLLTNEEQYRRAGTVAELRSGLQKKILEIASPDEGEEGAFARAGLARGKLDTADYVTYSDEELFSVYLPDMGAAYLRTYAGSDYTGKRWRNRDCDTAEDARREDAFFEAVAQADEQSFKPVGDSGGTSASRMTSTPIACEAGEYTDCSDRCDIGGYLRLGTFEKWLKANEETISKLELEPEGEERTPAYESFLEVPEDLRETVTIPELEGRDTFETIDNVRKYLSKTASYSLAPGHVPEGADYIEYFLTTGKKGYCAHFASAAVMIFRALGIPARYAEGYRVVASAGGDGAKAVRTRVVSGSGGSQTVEIDLRETAVMDRNAHAWAEVYIDGFGWYTAEVTPGYYRVEAATPDQGQSGSGKGTGSGDGSASGDQRKGTSGGGQEPKDSGTVKGGESKKTSSDEDKERDAETTAKPASQGKKTVGLRVVFTIAVILAVAFAVWRLSSRRRRGELTLRESVLEDFRVAALIVKQMTGLDILEGGEASEEAGRVLAEKYGIGGLDKAFDAALRARFARECTRSDKALVRSFRRSLTERFLADKKGPSKLLWRWKLRS